MTSDDSPSVQAMDKHINARTVGEAVWLAGGSECPAQAQLAALAINDLRPEVLPTEDAVARVMLDEIRRVANEKTGVINLVITQGGGEMLSLFRLLVRQAETNDKGDVLDRLNLWTQDALAPISPASTLSVAHELKRLLGDKFSGRVSGFNLMRADFDNRDELVRELARYVEELERAGGADIFFVNHNAEPQHASSLAYIEPHTGAQICDVAGILPAKASTVERYINDFKANGNRISNSDEAECRRAKYLLTLAPAAIMNARCVVQTITSADDAKRASYRRAMLEIISSDAGLRARQLDANPGLWIRLHPRPRSLVTPSVMT